MQTHINTNKHTHQDSKADTAFHKKHIKMPLQGFSCCSEERSPAHCTPPFVERRTQNQRALTCAGCGQPGCGESSTDPDPPFRCHAGSLHCTRISCPPWLAPLFSHPIRLSAKTFDMRLNMVPVFLQYVPSLGLNMDSAFRLLSSHTTSWCLHTWEIK